MKECMQICMPQAFTTYPTIAGGHNLGETLGVPNGSDGMGVAVGSLPPGLGIQLQHCQLFCAQCKQGREGDHMGSYRE